MQADSYGIGRRRRATFLRDGAWGQTGSGSGNADAISAGRDCTYSCHQRCLFSMLGIYNRRKNGLKWAFVSIEFRKNTYFNCAFMPCFALESDLRNWWGKR